MSWLNSSFTEYAKQALSQAQASIDKALEINPDQDPLAESQSSSSLGNTNLKKQIAPNVKVKQQNNRNATLDEWSSWGQSTVNSLWEGSFTGATKPKQEAKPPRKTSKALKLGGKSTKPKSSQCKADIPLVVPSHDQPRLKTADSSATNSSVVQLNEIIVSDAPEKNLEAPPKLPDPLPNPNVSTIIQDEIPIEPTTPTLSHCSSSSGLSQLNLTRSTSSNSSHNTITEAKAILHEYVPGEEIRDRISEHPASNSGWNEDDVDIDDKESSDPESKESFEQTEHKRCLSIGSTASSSILMLQSPGETTDKSDEKSEDDTLPALPTPTNLSIPSSALMDTQLVSQAISEEATPRVEPPNEPQTGRVITSPVHSEHSDLVILSEENSSPTSSDVLKLKEILHAREQRLFALNKEYAQIQDDLSIERQKSYNLEQQLTVFSNKHAIAVQELSEELSAVEEVKKCLETELNELKSAGDITILLAELKEKNDLVEELTMEGEKLSQQSFNSQNIVKKIRLKEKEDEKIIQEQKTKIASQNNEIERLKKDLSLVRAQQKESGESISDLNSLIKNQSEELQELRLKAAELETESKKMTEALEATRAKINELKELNVQAEFRINQESISANAKAKEGAEEAINKIKEEADVSIKQLNAQMREYQEMISNLEEQGVWREQRHRNHIQELMARIEDADGRNQDLSSSISNSTQPLLRQIQLLQESQASQQRNWEELEKHLNSKLEESRSNLHAAEMEKRDFHDKLQVSRNKITALQSQLDMITATRNETEVALEVLQSKHKILEDERGKDQLKFANVKAEYLKSFEESRNECEDLRAEIDRLQLLLEETEQRKVADSLPDDDIILASRSSTPPLDTTSQSQILERSLSSHYGGFPPVSPAPSQVSVCQSSYGIEKLTSQLKQCQSEVIVYQEQVKNLTVNKAALATEITALSQRCSELEQSCSDLPKVKRENKELQTRYATLLEMYGEKAEECQELKLDLNDVREAYKAQIEQLLSKVIK